MKGRAQPKGAAFFCARTRRRKPYSFNCGKPHSDSGSSQPESSASLATHPRMSVSAPFLIPTCRCLRSLSVSAPSSPRIAIRSPGAI